MMKPEPPSDRGEWMQVYGGKPFFPNDPRIEDIDFTAIAEALSKICRFGGHTRGFYSVAEHCWLMSNTFRDKELALMALVHDAAEAYVGDMIRPLKRNMPVYRNVEDKILDLIGDRLGFKMLSKLPDEIKDADNRILLDERKAVLHEPPYAWYQDTEGLKPLGVMVTGMPYYRARYEWETRFRELTR